MRRARGRVAQVLGAPFRAVRDLPIVRRVSFHTSRIRAGLDFHFFRTLAVALVVIVVVAAFLVTVLEPEKRSAQGLTGSAYWAVTTVIGSGDSSLRHEPRWVRHRLAARLLRRRDRRALTAAIVGFVIDFLLKEGQGMGASGYEDHIVVCGWNSTARELVEELRGDEFTSKIVVRPRQRANPAGEGVYFVRGDARAPQDLERAGIAEASAAIVCPVDGSNEADMRSILAVLAIETMAPGRAHGGRGQQPQARRALRGGRTPTRSS